MVKRGMMVKADFVPVLAEMTAHDRGVVLCAAFNLCFGLEESRALGSIESAFARGIARAAEEFEKNAIRKGVFTNSPKSPQTPKSPNSPKSPISPTERKKEKKEGKKEVCAAHTHTLEEIVSWAEVHFSPVPPRAWLEEFHRRKCEDGWTGANGRPLLGAAWQRELSAWWAREQKNISARASDAVRAPVTGSGADSPCGGVDYV